MENNNSFEEERTITEKIGKHFPVSFGEARIEKIGQEQNGIGNLPVRGSTYPGVSKNCGKKLWCGTEFFSHLQLPTLTPILQ